MNRNRFPQTIAAITLKTKVKEMPNLKGNNEWGFVERHQYKNHLIDVYETPDMNRTEGEITSLATGKVVSILKFISTSDEMITVCRRRINRMLTE